MMSDERKQRQLLQHGKKESTFLRLRRTKLGLDDFRTVKVIGKGAFGEVRAADCPFSRDAQPPVYRHTGPTGSENRYWQNLRDEDVEEGGDVEKGTGNEWPFLF